MFFFCFLIAKRLCVASTSTCLGYLRFHSIPATTRKYKFHRLDRSERERKKNWNKKQKNQCLPISIAATKQNVRKILWWMNGHLGYVSWTVSLWFENYPKTTKCALTSVDAEWRRCDGMLRASGVGYSTAKRSNQQLHTHAHTRKNRNDRKCIFFVVGSTRNESKRTNTINEPNEQKRSR